MLVAEGGRQQLNLRDCVTTWGDRGCDLLSVHSSRQLQGLGLPQHCNRRKKWLPATSSFTITTRKWAAIAFFLYYNVKVDLQMPMYTCNVRHLLPNTHTTHRHPVRQSPQCSSDSTNALPLFELEVPLFQTNSLRNSILSICQHSSPCTGGECHKCIIRHVVTPGK